MEKQVIYPVLTRFFESYLTARNIEDTLSMISDDIYSVGTGDEEVAYGKEELKQLLQREIAALPNSIGFRIENYTEKRTGEHTWECCCRMETMTDAETQGKVYYRTRLTAAFKEENGRFLATALHMSESSRYQETEEYFPLKYVSENARELNGTAQHELVDILCQMMPGGIIGGYIEEGFPLYVVNDTMLEMMGYTYDEFIEATGGNIENSFYEKDRERVTRIVMERMRSEKQYAVEYRVKKKDGTYLWVYDIGRKIVAADGRDAIISVLVDISDSMKVRKHLMEEAEKDSLTGIYNRKSGELMFDRKMRKGEPYIFLMIDLDNFKRVNDIYGHEAGDKMLRFTGQLLKNSFRQTDVAFRLGGDEFVLFAHPCSSIDAIREKAENMISAYQKEAEIRYPLAGTSVSMGGVYGTTAKSFSDLYKKADRVLYEIKYSSKGRCVIRELES